MFTRASPSLWATSPSAPGRSSIVMTSTSAWVAVGVACVALAKGEREMKPNLGAVGLLVALTVIGATETACAGQSSGLAQQDQTYLIQNAQTDMAEIAAGQLAVQKGTTDQIRGTGQTMIQDHQRVLDQV